MVENNFYISKKINFVLVLSFRQLFKEMNNFNTKKS